MKDLDREALFALVRGTDGETNWNNLNRLTDEELYDLLKNIL